jgi:vacuolar-type H+-ATPase catalytic subunit A/Vma1
MHDRYEAADTAMHRAFDAAERVAVLLDRYAYDNGDDAAPIEGWTDRLRQLEREIVATLGEPRRRLPCGGLVPSRDPKMGAKL